MNKAAALAAALSLKNKNNEKVSIIYSSCYGCILFICSARSDVHPLHV